MKRDWEPEELIDCWTLGEDDWRLVSNKAGATRLGFCLLLKYFELEARFPRHAGEVPKAAVDYVAQQVKVNPAEFARYDWTGRSIERHRAQIRTELGFREVTVGDEDKLAVWLAEEVCPTELGEDRLREALLARCRAERIEPPGPSRIERILGSARAASEQAFCARTVERLPAATVAKLLELVDEDDDRVAAGPGVLAELKADPGRLGLETMLTEIGKLGRIRDLGLPAELFADAAEKLLAAWRARAARMYPSDFRDAPRPIRLTLLAALCWVRTAELVDGLVDLLLGLVHKIDTRAETRVERELFGEWTRIRGKDAMLVRIATAATGRPDGTVREVIFPVAGEHTLRDVIREARANQRTFQERKRIVLRSSYSSYYRKMLPKLLGALTFHCNNTAYRPVMDAPALLGRYADRPGTDRFYDPAERVPMERVVPDAWADALVDDYGKVERIPYELCVLKALREAIRRREIWVQGATRWRGSGGRPAAGLRRQPGRALRRDPPAPGPRGGRRGVAAAARWRARPPQPGPHGRHQRRGADHPAARCAVDHRATDGQAAAGADPGRAARGGPAPLGRDRPARRPQGRRLPHRLHRRVHHHRQPRDHRPGHPAPPAAAVLLRAGHQHGHPAGGLDRRARRARGRAAAGALPVCQP
jgi:hypothetical protein